MTPGVAFRLLETATEDPRITRVRTDVARGNARDLSGELPGERSRTVKSLSTAGHRGGRLSPQTGGWWHSRGVEPQARRDE
jgi:hypothetical protein